MELVRTAPPRRDSAILQAGQQSALTSPSTGSVVGAFVDETFQGLGSYNADVAASEVLTAQKQTPLTKEQYLQSPNYRAGVPYNRNMTEGSAEVLSKQFDETSKRAEIMNDASSGQRALGYVTAFGAGMFERKNLATGVATTAILSPLAETLAPAVAGIRNIARLRRLATMGGAEGLVSAAIMEPSNRESAKILQQDYTMADTAWNVGLSTVLGVGLNTVPHIIKAKWDAHKINTPEIVGKELDLATEQLVRGQRVDVGMIERGVEVSTKPVAEKAAAVESFVKYTETPEFKTRFEGSKVVDESGAPLRVYHGTKESFNEFSPETVKNNRGFWFAGSPDKASGFAMAERKGGAGSDGANVRPVYLSLKNPYIHTPEAKMTMDKIFDAARAGGHDGIIFKGKEGSQGAMVAFSPDQIISAFGADDMDTIAKRIDAENKTAVSKAVKDSADPLNDTAIDMEAAKQTEQFEETLTDDEAQALADFEDYQQQIKALEDEGIPTAQAELMDALDNMNEADVEEAYKNLYACLTRG